MATNGPKSSESDAKKEALKSAYKAIFNSADGKKILENLCKVSGYKEEIFTPCNEETNYKLGKRAIYIYILKMIEEKGELT